MNKFLNKIIIDDVLEVLPKLPEKSVDIILTDPPYFLDKLDNNWNLQKVSNGKNQKVVQSLPAGMKFDREQGENFYKWYNKVAEELLRVLKPGGFFFSFSSPRLYHRLASAVDDAGFNIRDCFLWLYTQNQAKAMSLNHFIDKGNESKEQKELLKEKLNGWKTPQLKSCFEPILFSQKPTEGTFLDNIKKYKTGLVNTKQTTGDNMFPANVMTTDFISPITDKVFLVSKPSKQEKGDFNGHLTVKPLALCEHLLRLVAFDKKAVVLDPFLGSGTTAIAAKNLGLNYIGIEINKEYGEIAKKRLQKRQAILFEQQHSGNEIMYKEATGEAKIEIMPATEARKEFFSIIRDASQEKSFYVITVGGLPTATIVSFDKDKLSYGDTTNKRANNDQPNANKRKAKRAANRKRTRWIKR